MCLYNSKHLVTTGKDYINNSRDRPASLYPGAPGAEWPSVEMEEGTARESQSLSMRGTTHTLPLGICFYQNGMAAFSKRRHVL